MAIWFDHSVVEDGRGHFTNELPSFRSFKKLKNVKIGLIDSPSSLTSLYQNISEDPSLLLAIDGEIDNLSELASRVNLITEDIDQIIFALYDQEGPEGFYRIQGAVSLILYDFQYNRTILYRAFLKGYPLYFSNKNSRLTVCTNPLYLLPRNDLSDKIDKSKIAKLFAVDPRGMSTTVFSDIEEVAHGEIVSISSKGIERKKQALDEIFSETHSYKDEKKAVDTYRSLLETAVNASIKPEKKYGIMLSSGMDSTTVAYFAAKKLHEEGRELTAYSWTLPEDSADESEKIISFCEKLKIPLKMFNGEMFGPFDKLDDPFLLPHTPFVNSFWPINQECYRRASEDGVDILLNGNYGDLLFRERSSQVKSLWKDKRIDLLFIAMIEKFKNRGLKGVMKSLLRQFRLIQKQDKHPKMPWLTQEGEELITQDVNILAEKGFEDFDYALSSFHAGYLGGERYLSAPYGLERIEPQKDQYLLGFSLRFPLYMTYWKGQTKYFAREAMRGLIPEEIRIQPRVGNLVSFSMKSFLRNRTKVYEKVMEDPSLWNFYVNEEWMREKLKENADLDNYDLYIIGLCIDLSAWQKAIKPGGSLYEGKSI